MLHFIIHTVHWQTTWQIDPSPSRAVLDQAQTRAPTPDDKTRCFHSEFSLLLARSWWNAGWIGRWPKQKDWRGYLEMLLDAKCEWVWSQRWFWHANWGRPLKRGWRRRRQKRWDVEENTSRLYQVEFSSKFCWQCHLFLLYSLFFF